MSYELDIVHPATAAWLKKHGYTFKHEVIIAVGRVDFIATHSDGHQLIVECKANGDDYRAALRQIHDYVYYMGDGYRAAFALPVFGVTKAIRNGCKARNVMLIELDLDKPEPKPYQPGITLTENQMKRLAFFSDLTSRPHRHIKFVMDFHQSDKTNLLRDLYRLLELIQVGFGASNARVTTDDVSALHSLAPIKKVLESLIAPLETDYQTLSEFVDRSLDAAVCREAEYNKLARPYVNEYGIVPANVIVELKWQAEKATEFYCMADMIDHFDMDDNGTFYDDNGNKISGSLIWDGSATSFDDAQSWNDYHSRTKASYFAQFEFLQVSNDYSSDK